ncbi:hypothetical protein FQN49_000682 [Arthroderma sp. PD_2]|nr:hypothetical protein FQN49_000682 [Arthroderma sp. PD_2]
MDDKSPSFCRLCNLALASPDVWRQHAKSEWHIYNLRLRVAEPGSAVLPPPSSAEKAVGVSRNVQYENESDESGESDANNSAAPEFNPEKCLFCDEANTTFDDNLVHMSKAHSFVIPYQDHLTVDIETLLRHLHLVIYENRKCILCATRRRTVEGVHHHMMAKGHCRFDVSSDIAKFYKTSEAGDCGLNKIASTINTSLRLPSGMLANHRTRPTELAVLRKSSRQSVERRVELTTLPLATSTNGTGLVTAQDDNTPLASCTQISQLSRGDQQALARLSIPEVRSLLAIRAKHIDQSRREETHSKLKLEKAGNTTLTAHFRADTSKRFRGPWG